jgi:16S rRNA (cytosine1402-N4)-methyltransferase
VSVPNGHVPVLLAEVLEQLGVEPGWTVVDATVGLGGHAAALADRLGEGGRLIGIDRDPDALEIAKERIAGCRTTFIHGDFGELGLILRDLGIKQVDAVLADLGVSSPQLDRPERGFGFQREGPLDMRMNPLAGEPASALVARLSAEQLARMIREFGEERYSRRIAARIVAERTREPIATTTRLAEIVRASVPKPKPGRGERIDPATRTFQALRIAVNDELDALEGLLAQTPAAVRAGGKLAVISFHSLEDRRAKRALREPHWLPTTKKPIVAGATECHTNPRARSAKLRVGVRLG